jgi:hypothetical protein
MKKQSVILILLALMPAMAYTQCTPDAVNCQDVETPGQICPEILADGYMGLPYNQTVTILPPASFIINDIPVTIVKIKVDTVTQLPPGIVYEANATEMFPGTAYCVLISGTPTQAGIYKLNIRVIPYIDIFGDVVELPPVENDTSVQMTIHSPDGADDLPAYGFQAIENSPNPFEETTKIGYEMDESSEVRLTVYNQLGLPVYYEAMRAKTGRNFFRFSGENLLPGCYIYSIIKNKATFSGKMIKSR